ncbi:MAG: lamin tail domain-containing protein, partial [Bacteroidota bacterium]|nr:lamin tail domain-containing protein [Bacteroidota bacterium]
MRFSTWFASAILMWSAGTAWAQCDNLFFSEAAEGSSNNKYLEIYNPTGADVDLSGYAFPSVSNAPSVAGEYEFWNTFPEGAMVATGDVYIIAHPSSDPTILAEADHTFTFLSNGDDGFILVQGDETSFVQIDAVGDWNGDPGSGWDVAGVTAGTKEHTIVRKASVLSGNGGDWSASAGTDADNSEWIVLDQNDWSNLAIHTFDGCGPGTPGCTNANATNYDASATEDDGSCLFDNACNVDGVVVEASSFQYNPANLNIEPGQTVVWSNLGGTHDVNGDINSQTGSSFGNPEAFYLAPVVGDAAGVCMGS